MSDIRQAFEAHVNNISPPPPNVKETITVPAELFVRYWNSISDHVRYRDIGTTETNLMWGSVIVIRGEDET